MSPALNAAAGIPAADRMALIFQDLLTAIARIRAGRRSVASGEAFRGQALEALRAAEQEARRKGYTGEQARHAVFAIVAFLDESVLNSSSPAFHDWARRPLQEELFAGHLAGETFYQNVRDLLIGEDSHRVADVLEVYQLCLSLGYRGRYSKGREAEVRAVQDRISEKLRRIRPLPAALCPQDLRPDERPPLEADALVKPLLIAAGASAVLAAVLFVAYRLSLGSMTSGLQWISTVVGGWWLRGGL